MTPDATRDTQPQSQPKYLLTITDAARALGVSVRTVQRRLDAGEYEAAAVAGKRCVRLGTSDFPEGPPEDATLDLAHDATGDSEHDSLAANGLKVTRDVTGDSERDSTALVSLRGASQVQALAALLDAVAEARSIRRSGEHQKPTAQESAAKLLLNLEEAQALTGLSRAALRAAIQSGELQARRLGRSWKVRRADLESYLEQIFK